MLRHLSALGISSILFTHSHASPITTNVGGIFDVNFYNNGDSVTCGLLGTYTSDKDWTQEQMNSLTRALETWDAIIDNTPGRNMSVSVFWQNQGAGYLASATSSNKFTMGLGGEAPSYVERIWKGGETISTTAKEPDIIIVCNSYNYNNYYYGEAANGQQAVSLGETLSLEGTTLTVFNPTTYQDGSSFAHIDPVSDPDAVMQSTITNDTSRRMLSEKEFLLMERMGWDMVSYSDVVPEPSTTTLTLFTLVALSLRCKRTA